MRSRVRRAAFAMHPNGPAPNHHGLSAHGSRVVDLADLPWRRRHRVDDGPQVVAHLPGLHPA